MPGRFRSFNMLEDDWWSSTLRLCWKSVKLIVVSRKSNGKERSPLVITKLWVSLTSLVATNGDMHFIHKNSAALCIFSIHRRIIVRHSRYLEIVTMLLCAWTSWWKQIIFLIVNRNYVREFNNSILTIHAIYMEIIFTIPITTINAAISVFARNKKKLKGYLLNANHFDFQILLRYTNWVLSSFYSMYQKT